MKNISLARLKLLSLILTSTLIILIKNLVFLAFLFAIVIIAITNFKLKNRLLPRLTSLMMIGLLIISFQLIFNTSASLGNRLIMGLIASLRILILSILVFLYTGTSSPSEIVTALSFLPSEIQLLLTITFSLIPRVFTESQKIMLIQSTRGYNSKSLNIFKSVIPLIIPLIHRTLRRAEQITLILQTRGTL